ncbi:MAG: DUF924 domain-containing protein [Sandaracinaceae bacterium]|nr:DUF924 domain-containing protein [Sandaracinaceae bacterium]
MELVVSTTARRLDRAVTAARILSYWFADLDDRSVLDPTTEPMRTCYARWYGKSPAIDEEIRARFEADLDAVVSSDVGWLAELDAWAEVELGLLALVILLDQLPRNMYRGTPRMYAYDALALAATSHAIRAYEDLDMPLVRRMFLYVPLMHVEALGVQREMTRRFERLRSLATTRAPSSVGFFDHALRSARRHAQVVEAYGRFPHRNPILGRASTPEEEEYLRGPDPGF